MQSPVWRGIRTHKPSSFAHTPRSDEKIVDCISGEQGIKKGVKENKESCKCNKHLSHSFPELDHVLWTWEEKRTSVHPASRKSLVIALMIFLSKVGSSLDEAKENSKPTEKKEKPNRNDKQKYLSLEEVLLT